MNREEYEAAGGGKIAMKLLQGYLWHSKAIAKPELPSTLATSAHLVLDEIRPPFAFFENGEPTENHVFYQLTVLEILLTWPDNASLHERAALASYELDPLLNATDKSVGWSLSEDLRPV